MDIPTEMSKFTLLERFSVGQPLVVSCVAEKMTIQHTSVQGSALDEQSHRASLVFHGHVSGVSHVISHLQQGLTRCHKGKKKKKLQRTCPRRQKLPATKVHKKREVHHADSFWSVQRHVLYAHDFEMTPTRMISPRPSENPGEEG